MLTVDAIAALRPAQRRAINSAVRAGTTGSRTLAANGIAQFRKITATEWLAIPMGTGLT